MTRARRGATPFALLTLTAVLLTGCGDDSDSERLSRSQASSTSSSGDDNASAEKQALFRVHQLIDGRNAIRQAPGTYRDASSIGFADDGMAKTIIAESLELEDKDRKQEGKVVLSGEPTVHEVDLNPERQGEAAVNPYVDVRACVDASQSHLVDAKGKKVAKSEGDGPRLMQFHVINRHWPSNSGWRVAWEKDLKKPC